MVTTQQTTTQIGTDGDGRNLSFLVAQHLPQLDEDTRDRFIIYARILGGFVERGDSEGFEKWMEEHYPWVMGCDTRFIGLVATWIWMMNCPNSDEFKGVMVRLYDPIVTEDGPVDMDRWL